MLGLSGLLFVSADFSEDTPQYPCLYPFCMEASLPKQRLALWISLPRALENELRIVLAVEVWCDVEGRERGAARDSQSDRGRRSECANLHPLLGTKTSSNNEHFSNNTAAQKHAVFPGFFCP